MNNRELKGFQEELCKTADIETGLQGLAFGAILGALMATASTELLKHLIAKNQHLAILMGAAMGGAAMGGTGFVMGKKTPPPTTNITLPPDLIRRPGENK